MAIAGSRRCCGGKAGLWGQRAIQRLQQTAQSQHYRGLCGAGSTQEPLSTLMACADTTALSIWVTAISGWTIFQGRVRSGCRPYQRQRGLPGHGQSAARQIQGPAKAHLPPAPQTDRMALQPARFQQGQAPATIPPEKTNPLGKTLWNFLSFLPENPRFQQYSSHYVPHIPTISRVPH